MGYSDTKIKKIKFLLNVRNLTYKLAPMAQNKLSSRLYMIIKSAAAAAALPIIFIYVMIAKPDYKIMNAAAHVVLPVAGAVGDLVTWPIRFVRDTAVNIGELSNLRAENEELRVRLDEALRNKTVCDIAIAENDKLSRELDVVRAQPRDSVIADVVHDAAAFHHNTFFIDRGARDGIESGMVVTSTNGHMAGIVIDVATDFARVRALTDSNTNIAVRIVGTDVYGFLQGAGTTRPTIGFFSNPQFQPKAGQTLITSSISGVLPSGIMVGQVTDDLDVEVLQPSNLSRVMVLKFDTANEYK